MFRFVILAPLVLVFLLGAIHAKPAPTEKKVDAKKSPAFKPIEINGDLNANDEKDVKLDGPAKRYTVQLQKDKSYLIDLASSASTCASRSMRWRRRVRSRSGAMR